MPIDKPGLNRCLDKLADHLGADALSSAEKEKLVAYVTLRETADGREGKDGQMCYEMGLITRSEFVNLMLAHADTRICRNGADNSSGAIPKKLRREFERALLGSVVSVK